MLKCKLINKAAAASLMACLLLTSCADKATTPQSQGTDVKQEQTAVSAEASKEAPASSAQPLDLDEDLSKYDLRDDDSLEQIVSKNGS